MSVALWSTPYSTVCLQSSEHEVIFKPGFSSKKVRTQTEFDLLENSNPQDYSRKKREL